MVLFGGGTVTLAEVLFSMMQQNQAATQPTDIVVGTVTGVAPLEITMNTAMAPLRREVLYLTQAVVEKKIPALDHTHDQTGLSHTHSDSAGTTSVGLSETYTSTMALSNIAALENGKELPVGDGYIILNRGLEVGDTVLMLRVLHGQKFIILSRIFE